MASTDASLVARCRAGDLAAFDELVRRHQRRIVSIAFRLVGDADAAHDLAQEVFLSAFRNLRKFRGDSAFSTWLYRITYNTCMDELSRRRRGGEQSVDAFYGNNDRDVSLDIPDSSDTPEDALQRSERCEAVWRAIERLPAIYRHVLVLFDIEGLSYEEVSAIIGSPIGTVKSRLSRARLALLDALGEDLELFVD